MSFVSITPEMLVTAAADMEGIGSSMRAAKAAAAARTTTVLAAAGDDISAAIAGLFPAPAANFRRSIPRPRLFTSN